MMSADSAVGHIQKKLDRINVAEKKEFERICSVLNDLILKSNTKRILYDPENGSGSYTINIRIRNMLEEELKSKGYKYRFNKYDYGTDGVRYGVCITPFRDIEVLELGKEHYYNEVRDLISSDSE